MDIKIQDLLFVIVIVLLVLKKDYRLLVLAGIISLMISIPLFAGWIFFTAQRLVVYASFFFLSGVIFILFPSIGLWNKNDKIN